MNLLIQCGKNALNKPNKSIGRSKDESERKKLKFISPSLKSFLSPKSQKSFSSHSLSKPTISFGSALPPIRRDLSIGVVEAERCGFASIRSVARKLRHRELWI
ncbi:unnamed protein product [Rhodiola kirilowii]